MEKELAEQLDRLESKLNALLKLKMLTIDFGSVSRGYCRDKSLDILNEYVAPEEVESLRNRY